MADFTLDTSGEVSGYPRWDMARQWGQLSPFEQGYIGEALKAAGKMIWLRINGAQDFAFSDLAPSTLEGMLRDCALNREALASIGITGAGTSQSGADFWRLRQSRKLVNFPPQRLSLNDEGKIIAEAVA